MSSLTKGIYNRNLTYGALLCNIFLILVFLFFYKKLLTIHSWSPIHFPLSILHFCETTNR